METETVTTRPRIERPGTFDPQDKPLVLVVTTVDQPDRIERARMGVDLDDLQAIVQAAYDEHGILAQPWTDGGDR